MNNSNTAITIRSSNIYLGLVHIQNLELAYQQGIAQERSAPYRNLEDFVCRTGALRFAGKGKKGLLWEAYSLLCKQPKAEPQLFRSVVKALKLPQFESYLLQDTYNEIELLSFPCR